jgi:hypothetical protein
MKRISLQTKPFMVNDAENRLHSLGTLVSIKASAEQTGGAFNLFEVLLPTGYETPLHIHYAEDVASILEGRRYFWGEEKQAQVGRSFPPRGMPHGFRVTGNHRTHFVHDLRRFRWLCSGASHLDSGSMVSERTTRSKC